MVTLQKIGNVYSSQMLEIVGLSSDKKPTGTIEGIVIANGSVFKEIDTGKWYLYDIESKTWNKNINSDSYDDSTENVTVQIIDGGSSSGL